MLFTAESNARDHVAAGTYSPNNRVLLVSDAQTSTRHLENEDILFDSETEYFENEDDKLDH